MGSTERSAAIFDQLPQGQYRRWLPQLFIDLFVIRCKDWALDHSFCMVTQHESVVSPV